MQISSRAPSPRLLSPRRAVLAFLPLLALWSVAPSQAKAPAGATEHPFLWRIEAKDGKPLQAPAFLYGTMHLGDRRLVTIPDIVDKAIDEADALYCELAMDQIQKASVGMVKRMSLPRGQSLKKILPGPIYERLDAQLQRFGLGARQLNRMRVWAVSITFAQLEASKLGFTESLDDEIYKQADQDGKEVGGLETMDEQMEAISAGSQEDQIKMLDLSLRQMEMLQKQNQSSLGQLLEAYLTGDEVQVMDYMDKLMVDPVLYDRYMRPLLGTRNKRMADRIEAKLTKEPSKKFFFAIGAMHYVGADSILELMRAKGYRITRMQPPKANWKDVVALRTEIARLKLKLAKLQQPATK